MISDQITDTVVQCKRTNRQTDGLTSYLPLPQFPNFPIPFPIRKSERTKSKEFNEEVI